MIRSNVFFSASIYILGPSLPISDVVAMARLHRKCQACSVLFEADHRNAERQRFCPKPGCQRERRRQEQRSRRATDLERICAALRSDNPKGARRLQKASRVPEALIDSQSPIVIGLISMLIDSEDREEISNALQKLWEKGWNILHPPFNEIESKSLSFKKMDKPVRATRVKT